MQHACCWHGVTPAFLIVMHHHHHDYTYDSLGCPERQHTCCMQPKWCMQLQDTSDQGYGLALSLPRSLIEYIECRVICVLTFWFEAVLKFLNGLGRPCCEARCTEASVQAIRSPVHGRLPMTVEGRVKPTKLPKPPANWHRNRRSLSMVVLTHLQADACFPGAFMKVQLQLPALLGKIQPTCAIARYASAISWQECILRCCHAPMQRPAPTGTRTSVNKPMAALRHSRSSVPAAA